MFDIFTLISDDSQVKEELANKNSALEQNLQNVYVTSKGNVSTTMTLTFIINSVYCIQFCSYLMYINNQKQSYQ